MLVRARLALEYRAGGLESIIVSDNGEGMDQVDLRNAFNKHQWCYHEKKIKK